MPRQAQRVRASDEIVERLRHLIITLELAPGSDVTETYLRELLQCGRTPLREALQRLAAEHLVVATPRRGVSISELSIIDFRNLMEAASCIEPQVARLAAERITDDRLRLLGDLLADSEKASLAGQPERSAMLDWDFHHEMALSTRNPYLSESLDTLHRLSMRFVFLGFQHSGDAAEGALDDHRRIFAGLSAHDADAAEKAILEHCEHGRDRMRAAL
jgi:DNA-binding GntR family transcriptional regulator